MLQCYAVWCIHRQFGLVWPIIVAAAVAAVAAFHRYSTQLMANACISASVRLCVNDGNSIYLNICELWMWRERTNERATSMWSQCVTTLSEACRESRLKYVFLFVCAMCVYAVRDQSGVRRRVLFKHFICFSVWMLGNIFLIVRILHL